MVGKAFLVLGFLLAAFLLTSLEVTAREIAENTKEGQKKDVVEDAKYGTNVYTVHDGKVLNTAVADTQEVAGIAGEVKYDDEIYTGRVQCCFCRTRGCSPIFCC